MRKFGLIGKHISYSFSETYFKNKFTEESIKDAVYTNYDIGCMSQLEETLKDPELIGLNVTIPYKEEIIAKLDSLNSKAAQIGAVNTIKIAPNGTLKGFNTDYYGFEESLKPHLKKHHKKALILGTGGSSKAVAYALDRLSICHRFVSRHSKPGMYTYGDLNNEIINEHTVIINCTPIGTFPHVDVCPEIPYTTINSKHILFDLIYNPKETLFLAKGKKGGATTINGNDMLHFQAEKAWEIWNR